MIAPLDSNERLGADVTDSGPTLPPRALGHAAVEAGRTTAVLPAAPQRQRDVEARKAKERHKQRRARELADQLELAKGQELETVELLRPNKEGDWNDVQRRWLAGINRALDGLAERIVNEAASLGELSDIMDDA
jgi:hypothetical protein